MIWRRKQKNFHFQIERKDNLGKKRGYLRLTPAAKNVGEVKREIRVRDTITVSFDPLLSFFLPRKLEMGYF